MDYNVVWFLLHHLWNRIFSEIYKSSERHHWSIRPINDTLSEPSIWDTFYNTWFHVQMKRIRLNQLSVVRAKQRRYIQNCGSNKTMLHALQATQRSKLWWANLTTETSHGDQLIATILPLDIIRIFCLRLRQILSLRLQDNAFGRALSQHCGRLLDRTY